MKFAPGTLMTWAECIEDFPSPTLGWNTRNIYQKSYFNRKFDKIKDMSTIILGHLNVL